MSVITKDLGAATAYGYAVEKGYTGTEAEFAELMADYAEVGQRAEDAAESALNSKTAAQTAATTATNKASEATTAAQTATTKAGEASQSASQAQAFAQTASTKASEASASASTSTAKATEATTAAATATSAASTATTAKDDAVSAKTAAQTAQTGAETARDAVQSSAAQIATNASDITALKEDLNDLETDLEDVTETEVSRNLLPVGSKSVTVHSVSCEYSDGSLAIQGTATANGGRLTAVTDTFVMPAGTYTFSRNIGYGDVFIETGSSILAQLVGTTLSVSFTVADDTTCYVGINVVSGYSYNITQQVQLENGSEKTAWQAPSYKSATAVDSVARSGINEIGLPYESPSLSWTSGKAFVANAGWTDNSGWSYTDVDLIQGQSLDITLHCYPTVYPLSVWSADGTSILKACFPLASEEGEKHFIYACAAQHEKVRINVLTSYKSTVATKIYKPNNQVNISNIAAINHGEECFDVLHENIIAIGDSLTQGSYTGHDLHVNQSYPAFLAKKMGNTVANAGRAGWTTKQWWDGDSTTQKGFPYYTYSDYDTAVICLGTNGGLTDTLDTDVTPYDSYTDYADTNTGCYCKIIEGMKAQNASINILLCNIWAGGGTGGIDVTNTVINKIAAKYGLPVIDLLNEFRTAYSIYHAVSGNIHLGRIGYARMADIIRQAINNNVLDRPANYNYIPS